MGLTHGIHTISLYDHQGDNQVVQLNALVPDQSTFNLRQQNEGPTTPQGNRYNAGLLSEVDFVFLDVDGVAGSIETWQSNDTPVRLAAAGENKNVLWEEDTIPNIQPVEIEGAVGGRSDAYRVRMTHRTGRGDTHDIYGLANLLAKAGTRAEPFTDEDADNVPDGYSEFFDSQTFDNTAKEFSGGSTGAVDVLRLLVNFPISGLSFTESSEITQLHNDGDTHIRIRFKDSSNSTVKIKNSSVFNSTGRKSLTETSPSSVYEVLAEVLMVENATANNSDAKVQKPALRTDGKTTYLNG